MSKFIKLDDNYININNIVSVSIEKEDKEVVIIYINKVDLLMKILQLHTFAN